MKFLIVGDGIYLKRMKEELALSGNNEDVIFTGYRNDICELLDASDIFLTCTLAETFGNSIAEASNHCLPCVASNVGGIPEIIEDGVSGFLVKKFDIDETYDALVKLIENKKLREIMGMNGRKHIIKKFDYKSIEKKSEELYEIVLSK